MRVEKTDDFFEHHGVKGMKWGVRKDRGNKVQTADQKQRARMRNDSKNRRLLSDDQLTRKIQRIQNEKKLKDLTSSELTPGRKAANAVLLIAGTAVATSVLKGAAMYTIKSAMTREFNLKDAAGYLVPKPKK